MKQSLCVLLLANTLAAHGFEDEFPGPNLSTEWAINGAISFTVNNGLFVDHATTASVEYVLPAAQSDFTYNANLGWDTVFIHTIYIAAKTDTAYLATIGYTNTLFGGRLVGMVPDFGTTQPFPYSGTHRFQIAQQNDTISIRCDGTLLLSAPSTQKCTSILIGFNAPYSHANVWAKNVQVFSE